MGEPVWVAGVDGCPAGWIAVFRAVNGDAPPRMAVFRRFPEILDASENPATIAVDMPMGLPDRIEGPGRAAEQAVRPHLGQRQSSVFSVPSRSAVMAPDYRSACAAALATSSPPKKVSRQCFGLFPKICELDDLLTPELQNRVFEVHPEFAFWRLNGEVAMDLPKKVRNRPNPPGLAQRRDLLARFGYDMDFLSAPPPRGAGPDDAIDACVNAVIAERIHKGLAQSFPAEPPRDSKGLRIAIWA